MNGTFTLDPGGFILGYLKVVWYYTFVQKISSQYSYSYYTHSLDTKYVYIFILIPIFIIMALCVRNIMYHVNCIPFYILEKINIKYFSKLKTLMCLNFYCVTVNQEDHGFHINT